MRNVSKRSAHKSLRKLDIINLAEIMQRHRAYHFSYNLDRHALTPEL